MVTLISLPTDIKAYIVSYVVRQEDLRNLFLTCKDLYHVTIARVYHSIVIEEHCGMWPLIGLFHPQNEGLQHIRHVRVKTCSGDDDYHDCEDGNAENLHMMIAQSLPKDSLLTLTYVALQSKLLSIRQVW